jgi:hypothetical protein
VAATLGDASGGIEALGCSGYATAIGKVIAEDVARQIESSFYIRTEIRSCKRLRNDFAEGSLDRHAARFISGQFDLTPP